MATGKGRSPAAATKSATNQIISDGTHRYGYDFYEGNMTSSSNTATGVLTSYTWDHRNRLVGMVGTNLPDGATMQTIMFEYDSMNRRLTKRRAPSRPTIYNGNDAWLISTPATSLTHGTCTAPE